MSNKKPDELVQTSETPSKKSLRNIWKIVGLIGAGLAILLAVVASYVYAASPAVIRNPKFQHYHFRMQVLIDGKAENFGEEKYQTGYAKDNCNAALTVQPIHFHDNKDQMVHIHWDGMTGGMVLKYYGWNYIGGMRGALGYKLDNLGDIQKVTTHGDVLPAVSKGNNFYVYTGDENGYQERSFDKFLHQDLESFFGVRSNLPPEGEQQTTWLDNLFPKAYAHGSESHGNAPHAEGDEPETETEKLTRINNLLGNVVIFVQKDKPTDAQVKERFAKLEPLSDSVCGG